jgi:outer membrane autotransporter protein
LTEDQALALAYGFVGQETPFEAYAPAPGISPAVRVMNHSYGPNAPFLSVEGDPYAPEAFEALEQSAGLGVIHVFAAGNSAGKFSTEDSNKRLNNTSPFVITVGALGSDGKYAGYSSYGANLMVVAPSSSGFSDDYSIATTDRTGLDGYNNIGEDATKPPEDDPYFQPPGVGDLANYNSAFGGTSSASPLVAGVMALGVEANPNLDIRMARHLIARTSVKVDPSDQGWLVNGSGFDFNTNYGFGLLDADMFTRAAASVESLSEAKVLRGSTQTIQQGDFGEDTRAIGASFTVLGDGFMPLEYVQVEMTLSGLQDDKDAYLAGEGAILGDFSAVVVSPSGTVAQLFFNDRNLVKNQFEENRFEIIPDVAEWTFLSNAFFGESPEGDWSIELFNSSSNTNFTNFGVWDSYKFTFGTGWIEIAPLEIGAEGITTEFALPKTVRLDLNLTANQTFSATEGTLTISGDVDNQGHELTAYANQTISMTGEFSGSGNLVKTGAGVLALSGNNTNFTGDTTLREGILLVGHPNALNLPTRLSQRIFLSGGTLVYGPGISVDLSPRFVFAGDLPIDTNGNDVEWSAALGAGVTELRKEGVGTLTLTGVNMFQGPITISAGGLRIGGGGVLGGGNFSGSITNNGVLVYSSSAAQVLSGDIAGGGNLTVDGTGSLKTTGNVAASSVEVAAGLLSVDGRLEASSVEVDQQGILGGSGLVTASTISIAGTLAPGNSPGTLSLVGHPVLASTATTQIEIAGPGAFDRILVDGSITLAGALEVVPFGGFGLAYGQRYNFLSATGGILGEFERITAPETFRGRFLNGGTTGTLLIAPDTYTRVARTPNQRRVAEALDHFITAVEGDRETVSIALDLQSAEQYPGAFEQIMPGFYEGLADMAIERAFTQTQQLNQRMGAVRAGVRGFQAIGLGEEPLKHDRDGRSMADAVATNWNSWVMGTGSFSRSYNLSEAPGYKNDAGGFLAGADYRWSEAFSTGLYAGYQYNHAKYGGGSSMRGNSALFGAYASWQNKDGYYVNSVVGGGYTGYQARRAITFSTIDRTARANPNSGQFSAALNLGKDFEFGSWTVGPILGGQYTYAGVGGFAETGADSLDLALGQQNASSLRSTLGGRVAYTWEVAKDIAVIPEARMLWMHEFLNNPRTINAALEGGGGPSFGYETEEPYRDSVFAGVGLSARIGETWGASVFYNVNFGARTYLENSISASLGVAF